MRTRRRVLTVMALGLGALAGLGRSTPARAECPYFPIPSATIAARSAEEVFVGTVIENVGDQLYDFRLRIDHVFRGPAQVGDVRRMNFVFPGWPYAKAADGTTVPPCEAIPGWEGNVMAIALEARAPDGTGYNAASWISGDLPINRDLPRTTLDEIEAAAAMPATDAVGTTVHDPAPDLPPNDGAYVVVGVFLSALVTTFAWVRLRRARDSAAP